MPSYSPCARSSWSVDRTIHGDKKRSFDVAFKLSVVEDAVKTNNEVYCRLPHVNAALELSPENYSSHHV